MRVSRCFPSPLFPLVGAVILLSSCVSSIGFAQPLEGVGRVSLDKILFAFVANPWSSDSPFVRDSYLVLIDEEFKATVFQTDFSEASHLVWGKAGMYLADSSNDYLIDHDGRVHVKKAKKGTIANGAAFLAHGTAVVSVTNEGFTDSGYRQHVALLNSESTDLRTIGKYTDVFSVCGNSAYVLGGELSKLQDEEIERERIFLQQVVKDSVFEYREIRRVSADLHEVIYAGPTAPCDGRNIFVLADQVEYLPEEKKRLGDPGEFPQFQKDSPLTQFEPGSHSYASIERWNVQTGQRDVIPLRSDDGEFFRVASDEISNASYGVGSYFDGKLRWISGGGILYSTDVATGVTSPIHGIKFPNAFENNRYAIFSQERVDVLTHAPYSEEPVEIFSYDIASGHLLSHRKVDGLWGDIDYRTQIIRGFAVNPKDLASQVAP